MVGARDLLLGQLVQPQREPLGEAAVVDEHDRRAVLLDELEQLRVDRRPDRRATSALAAGAEQSVDLGVGARLAHVLDGTTTSRSSSFARAGVDEPIGRAARDEPPDLLHRPLGRGQADRAGPARRSSRSSRSTDSARCAPRFVPATACTSSRISVRTPRQHLAALRGQQQEERLRRRDQDVGRLAEHRRALLLRRVAGAHRDRELRLEPGERPAQVALDVVVQRLQRRDVERGAAPRRAPRAAGRCP